MTNERISSKTEREGVLNGIVTTLTLGRYSVETTTQFGYKDGDSGVIFQQSPEVRALKTGKPVYVSDMKKTEHVSRRVVKNK